MNLRQAEAKGQSKLGKSPHKGKKNGQRDLWLKRRRGLRQPMHVLPREFIDAPDSKSVPGYAGFPFFTDQKGCAILRIHWRPGICELILRFQVSSLPEPSLNW